MNTKTALDEMKQTMQELLATKAGDLDRISEMQEDAMQRIMEADRDMQKAAEIMDESAYDEASQRKAKAQIGLDMYKARYSQIRARKMITEAESDRMIDGVLRYEDELAGEFKAAAGDLLRELRDLLEAYRARVRDAELTLLRWQNEVHANYHTRGSSTYVDPLTGERTDRSPTPVMVHGYEGLRDGCPEAATIGKFLDVLRKLVAED